MSDLSSLKVLIVDDDPDMESLIRDHLTDMGFRKIESRPSGADGYECCLAEYNAGRPFDLVISDWIMQPVSGIEFLKRLRAHKGFKTLPVIFLTGVAEREQVRDALVEGASDYILKPFSNSDLSQRIQNIVHQISRGRSLNRL